MSWWYGHRVSLWRRLSASSGKKQAKSVWSIQHAWQYVGVVSRLVPIRLLPEFTSGGSGGTFCGLAPRVPGRGLVRLCQALSVGKPLWALARRPKHLPGLPCSPYSFWWVNELWSLVRRPRRCTWNTTASCLRAKQEHWGLGNSICANPATVTSNLARCLIGQEFGTNGVGT